MKILVMIPTYNERDNIRKLVEEIIKLNRNLDILIIDGDSSDGTSEIAEQLAKKYIQVKVVRLQGRCPEGLNRKEGYAYALAHNCDYLLEMDADLSHDPQEIPKFLEAIKECDLVIGSRFIRGGAQVERSFLRRVGSRLANMYIRRMLNIKDILDCTSGYRCYRKSSLEKISLDDLSLTGSAALIKVLFRYIKIGSTVKEIPIVYRERQFGKSKKNSPWFMIEALWIVFKLRFNVFA